MKTKFKPKYKIVKCDRCGKKIKIVDLMKIPESVRDELIVISVLNAHKNELHRLLEKYNICESCKKEYEKTLIPKFKREIDKFVNKNQNLKPNKK